MDENIEVKFLKKEDILRENIKMNEEDISEGFLRMLGEISQNIYTYEGFVDENLILIKNLEGKRIFVEYLYRGTVSNIIKSAFRSVDGKNKNKNNHDIVIISKSKKFKRLCEISGSFKTFERWLELHGKESLSTNIEVILESFREGTIFLLFFCDGAAKINYRDFIIKRS